MKKINILLFVSVIFFFLFLFFLFLDYSENRSEKLPLFYWPLVDKDIHISESILNREGLEEEKDYVVSALPVENSDLDIKEGQYINVRSDKMFQALSSILKSDESFEFFNPCIDYNSQGYHNTVCEKTYARRRSNLNDNHILFNVFFQIKGIKRCAFYYIDREIEVTLFEAGDKVVEPARAIVIIEIEDDISLDEKLLRNMALLTAGCNMIRAYDYFVSPENVVICSPEGEVFWGSKKYEEGSLEKVKRFSEVKGELRDRPFQTPLIDFSSVKVTLAFGYLILSIFILIWYFIKLKKVNS